MKAGVGRLAELWNEPETVGLEGAVLDCRKYGLHLRGRGGQGGSPTGAVQHVSI